MTVSFVAQSEFSQATLAGTSHSPTSALTLQAGDIVEVLILTKNDVVPTSVIDALGNNYVEITPAYSDHSIFGVYCYVAQNCAAGACVPVVADTGCYAIYCRQIRGAATSGACLGFVVTSQSAPGAGANILSSGNLALGAVAENVLLCGLNINTSTGTPAATAGSSPNAFSGRASVWSVYGAGNALTVPEDVHLSGASGNVAATYTLSSGAAASDRFLTVATAYLELPVPPYNETIKAIAIAPGYTPSGVATSAYSITAPTTGIPTVAAAVGYNTKTFDSSTVGSASGSMIPFNYFGVSTPASAYSQNGDGSFTLTGNGGDSYNATVASCCVDSTKPQGIRGVAFGGGMYAEVQCYYSGTQTGDGVDPMWFLDAIQALTSSTVEGWHSVEVDTWEANVPGSTTTANFQVHDDYYHSGAKGTVNVFSGTQPNCVVPAGSFNAYNTYGFLWVPATGSAQGYAQVFFNGAQKGSTAFWNKYSGGQAFPPAGANVGNHFDVQTNMLIIGCSNTATPLRVRSVRVWQASAAANITG